MIRPGSARRVPKSRLVGSVPGSWIGHERGIPPVPEDRRVDRDGIVVRVIRYTLDDPQRVGYGEVR
jgi:hypothetical protein